MAAEKLTKKRLAQIFNYVVYF
ncbi:hypothetical protein CGSHiGG_00990 [Haemophilus influenzae PittGG]|uniref:Uncharacterized protein n=1 Tax=Haemophilus influenzae (strain PittGG) TaxID=374931 RepID=A5UET8_HAEIG|nr:hypothetical protein CGSHiGG_00990 [Haemophilus influenzae PittGG]